MRQFLAVQVYAPRHFLKLNNELHYHTHENTTH